MKLIKGWGVSLASIILLLASFQNCGNQFLVDRKLANDSSLLTVNCESDLLALFKNDFHPFLKNNCGDCHSQGRSGSGYFADQNANLAWSHFISKTAPAIHRNATSSHRPPNTGEQHAAFLNPLLSRWNTLLAEKIKCETRGSNPLDRPIRLIAKSAMVTQDKQTLEWNLLTEVTDPTQQNLIPMSLKIDVRLFQQTGVSGFQFENLEVRNHHNKSIQLKILQIGIGEQIDSNLTSFVNLNTTLAPATEWINLSNGLAPAFTVRETQNETSFFIEIQSLQFIEPESLPQQILHSDLISTNGQWNVFRSACINCHNNVTTRGGLNLLDERQSASSSSAIIARMKDTARPMPPSGLLPISQITIVEQWVRTMVNNPALANP